MAKMIGNQKFKTASHCVFRLNYHIIFCTKFRRHVLTPEKREFLFDIIRKLAIESSVEIVEINGEEDHIHFLLDAPPTVCLSNIIGKLKSKSASALLNQFGSFFWDRHARTVWSSGYFVCSTGGAPLALIKLYIQNQGAANPP